MGEVGLGKGRGWGGIFFLFEHKKNTTKKGGSGGVCIFLHSEVVEKALFVVCTLPLITLRGVPWRFKNVRMDGGFCCCFCRFYQWVVDSSGGRKLDRAPQTR